MQVALGANVEPSPVPATISFSYAHRSASSYQKAELPDSGTSVNGTVLVVSAFGWPAAFHTNSIISARVQALAGLNVVVEVPTVMLLSTAQITAS